MNRCKTCCYWKFKKLWIDDFRKLKVPLNSLTYYDRWKHHPNRLSQLSKNTYKSVNALAKCELLLSFLLSLYFNIQTEGEKFLDCVGCSPLSQIYMSHSFVLGTDKLKFIECTIEHPCFPVPSWVLKTRKYSRKSEAKRSRRRLYLSGSVFTEDYCSSRSYWFHRTLSCNILFNWDFSSPVWSPTYC